MVSSRLSSPDGSDGSASGDSGWLDLESDDESPLVTSLFDSQTFTTLDEMLCHCQKHHGFDLSANIRRLRLDYMGAVKLVNFIRHCVLKKQPIPDAICQRHIDDDVFLKPVLQDDAVLYSLDDIIEPPLESSHGCNEQTRPFFDRIKQLEAELKSAQDCFVSYRLTVEETLNRRWGNEDGPPGQAPDLYSPSLPDDALHSDYYFQTYDSSEIHEIMLKDKVRTDAYRNFIYANKHLFVGKVVLDIGCGTGILSMLCAKAGAARVLAVDKSDIIVKARENVFNNGLSKVITCLRGAIEDVVLPVDEVDIIVSEWMGYCLLYEAMLPSVLYARDKYLKREGLLVPSSATLWIAPVEDHDYVSESVSYWRDVYGFDMRAMQEGIHDEVRIEAMTRASLCGDAFPFKVLDLRSVRKEDLEFVALWSSALNRTVDRIDGFLIWFDIFFSDRLDAPLPDPHITPAEWCDKNPGCYGFTTGPHGKETHWKQALTLVAQSHQTELPVQRLISGTITFSVPKRSPRALKIHNSWSLTGQKHCQSWDFLKCKGEKQL